MIKNPCSKHHWYVPSYSYQEWEPDDMKSRVFIVWKCLSCGWEKKELFMEVTGLTQKQIETILKTCDSQGFVYQEPPF